MEPYAAQVVPDDGILNRPHLKDAELNKFEPVELPRKERLGHRLSVALGATTFMFVATVSCILSYSNFSREVSQRVDSLEGTAMVFSASIAGPFSAGMKREVTQTLTAVGRFASTQHVSVADNTGKVYAQMGFGNHLVRKTITDGDTDMLSFLLADARTVSVPVIHSGVRIGSLSLTGDISDSKSGLFQNLLGNLAMALFLSALSVFVGRRFISTITKPIDTLSNEMMRIGAEGGYKANLPADMRGEIGVLSRAFGGLLEDVRERDTQLLDHQANLERKVRERTQALHEAKIAAEEANAAKSDFLATMSHEIRTPMNGMLVMAELLATAELNSRHRRYAEVVLKSGKGLLTIINDILDLSKIQAGKLSLENIPTNIAALSEDTLCLFWQQADEKGIDLACRVGKDVPEQFLGDPTRLNQIISNLINNALKFTDRGEVRLDINTTLTPQGESGLTICVRDTGIGIAEDKLAHVFDNFAQADQSTTRRFGGTGLGLAICQRLAHAMGGNITIESEVGKGSAFTLHLPSITCHRPAPASQQVNLDSGEKKTLLLLYPDCFSRDVLAEALAGMGFDPTLCDPFNAPDHNDFDWLVAPLDFYKRQFFANAQQTRLALMKMGDGGIEDLMSAGAIHEFINLPVTTTAISRRVGEHLAGLDSGHPVNRSLSAIQKTRAKLHKFSKAKILVADDSAVNREVIDQALRQFDVKPTLAANGLQVLEKMKEETCDLIFMDCSMPEMDGFEATRRLRESTYYTEHLPIVALTAHAVSNVTERAFAAGMDDILVKPFTISDLQSALLKWLPNKADDAPSPIEPMAESIATAAPNKAVAADMPVFDPALLENLRELAADQFPATLVRLQNLYRQSAPEIFTHLQEAFATNNHDEIVSTAHALRSMSLNIGAGALAAHLLALEESGRSEDLLIKFTQVEQHYLAVMDALQHDETPAVGSAANPPIIKILSSA